MTRPALRLYNILPMRYLIAALALLPNLLERLIDGLRKAGLPE